MEPIITQIINLIKGLAREHCIYYPTAYATAWVSRVPKLNDLTSPAFPKSLEWLKKHQMNDGSWGTVNPINPFANTIETLAAFLALRHWNSEENSASLSLVQDSLIKLAKQFNNEGQKTFGFELLLAGLIEETRSKKISLSPELISHYEKFLKIGDTQRQMLKGYLQQTQFQSPNIFWLCLETLGGDFLNNTEQPYPFSSNVLQQNGSLLASVAATAYLLIANRNRKQDLASASDYLNHLTAKNSGGVPPYHPMEQYELAFALDFLLKGGIPTHILQGAVERLNEFWQKRNGLGYSKFSPSIDADDCAIGIIVLKKANLNNVDYHPLLELFNGDYFSTYKEDPTPSVSVNANAVRALNYFKEHEEVGAILKKVLNWFKAKFKSESLEQLFNDSWHISPFYAASSIIFALAKIDEKMTEQCANWLLSQQHANGGWGYFEDVTLEETALATLALSHIKKNNLEIAAALARAKNYLNSDSIPTDFACLYKGTTMVCPVQVVSATILAARYAVNH